MSKGARLRAARRAGQKCIFCGEPVSSQQHIWPQWLKHTRTIDHTPPKHFHDANDVIAVPGEVTTIYHHLSPPSTHGGAMTNRKLPVVCVSCNTSWMSRLENRAKNILIPMIDDAPRNLSLEEQRMLSRWIDQTVAVMETTRPQYVVSSAADRARLMSDSDDAPALYTQVWLGHNGSDEPSETQAYNRAVISRVAESGEVVAAIRSHVIVCGHVVLYSIGSPEPEYGGYRPSVIGEFASKLQRIWPPSSDSVSWPPAERLAQADIMKLAEGLTVDASVAASQNLDRLVGEDTGHG